jgi:hypothetical protein
VHAAGSAQRRRVHVGVRARAHGLRSGASLQSQAFGAVVHAVSDFLQVIACLMCRGCAAAQGGARTGTGLVFATAPAHLLCPRAQGENAVILAYGAPRTGKSYTLEGAGGATHDRAGVIMRSIKAIHSHLTIVPREKYRLYATCCGASPATQAVHTAQQDGTQLGPGLCCSTGLGCSPDSSQAACGQSVNGTICSCCCQV